MSSIATQLLINKLNLPIEIIDIVKDYIFHKIKKLSENDERYTILETIPFKEYDPFDDTIYVYLTISQEKDYFLVYKNFKIQLLTLGYGDDNEVYFVDGSIFTIE